MIRTIRSNGLLISTFLMTSLLSCSQQTGDSKDSSKNDSASSFTGKIQIISNPSAVAGFKLYQETCLKCHGDFFLSSVASASASQIQTALQNIPSMAQDPNVKSLNADQIRSIADALKDLDPKGEDPFGCSTTVAMAPPIVRVSFTEYKSLLGTLLGSQIFDDRDVLSSLSAFPTLAERPIGKIQSASRDSDDNVIDSLEFLAWDLGHKPAIIQAVKAAFANCDLTSSECNRAWITKFLQTASRSLAPSSLVDGALSLMSNASTPDDGIGHVTSLVLNSPYFIFDLSGLLSKRNDPKTATLTAQELASRLALSITGDLPDATLQGKAQSQVLLDPNVYTSEIIRLLRSPKGKEHTLELFRELFSAKKTTLPNVFPANWKDTNPNSYLTSIQGDFDRFVNEVVYQQHQTLLNLLQNDVRIIQQDPILSKIYQVPASSNKIQAGTDRKGILTLPMFLAAADAIANPIHRGVDLLTLSCNFIRPLTPAEKQLVDQVSQTSIGSAATVREVAEKKTSANQCQVCHQVINPLGFAFGKYDGFGLLQTTEVKYDAAGNVISSAPIQTATTAFIRGRDFSISDAIDLEAILATEKGSLACMSEQILTYYLRRNATISDQCQLSSIYRDLKGFNKTSSKPLLDTIQNIFLHPLFKYKLVD